MQKTRIDWGIKDLFTWNPITGCKRNCSINGKNYCYAKRIHNRFNKTTFSEIVFHKERMCEPEKLKKPATIFVGSMSDIEYWDKTILRAVISKCEFCPQHTFMFLSKNPKSYVGYNWPDNTMQGLTITKADDYCDMLSISFNPHPFLSIEPLLGEIKCPPSINTEKIIVGAQTGSGSVIPKKEWIDSIKKNCPADKIFWKGSMREYL